MYTCMCTSNLQQRISSKAEVKDFASLLDGLGCMLCLVNGREVKQSNISLIVVVGLQCVYVCMDHIHVAVIFHRIPKARYTFV